MNTRYNPHYHNSVVANVREFARQNKLNTEHLTDEQIYKAWCDCYFCDDPEKEILITITSLQQK